MTRPRHLGNVPFAVSLHVHRSNQMEALVGRLAEVVAEPAGGVLEPECIVVQGLGMERWVSTELAQRLGVWANPDFPFPRRLVTRAIETILGEPVPAGGTFEPETLLWSIADLLRSQGERPELAPIRAYLERDPRVGRRLQLAERIARTFDQYVVYRPTMVLAWERGIGTDWQALLWRAIVDRHGSSHAATLATRVVAALRRGSGPISGFPARLSFFGISTLPPLYLETIVALARRVEVHLFLLSPSRQYWAWIRSQREIIRAVRKQEEAGAELEEKLHLALGNPLLASLGRLGREFQETLEGAVDYAEDDRDLYAEPGRATMLGTIQSDMLDLLHRRRGSDEAPQIEIPAADGSITIHSCHGSMREVEVLHDQLLDLFENDATLEPRDVVLMSPAIGAYAPFIDAVFGRGRDEPSTRPEIPYRISDRTVAASDDVVDAFTRVVDVLRGRMGAPAVLDLLAIDSVRMRFGIEAEELDALRRWVSESGIRWGVDPAHRQEVEQPPLRENTWRFGLERLLLGYAMPGRGRELYGGVLPHDDIEGSETALLGRFADFCETLFDLRLRLRQPRPVTEWRAALADLLGRMVSATARTAHQHQRVRDALQKLEDRATSAGFTAPLDLDALRARLDFDLGRSVSTHGFLAGGVTFCALVPMRSIPFRVVCLLGMNDGAFPRVERPPGFDLMGKRRRPGDRSQRDDDRYLFLEALLSARERLLITYVGQSIHDNSEAPPSVVVSEILDALDESFRVEPDGKTPVRELVVVRHPLQAFSPSYFGWSRDERLFSYQRGYYGGAETLARGLRGRRPVFLGRPLAPDPETERALTIDELASFFENPSRSFLQRRLGLYLGNDLEILEDREPLELDELERWRVGNDLLERAQRGEDLSQAFAAVRAAGAISPGVPGECLYTDLRVEAEQIARLASKVRAGSRLPPVTVELAVEGTRVTGILADLWRAGQLRSQFSKLGGAKEIGIWIRHLALCAAAPSGCDPLTFVFGRPEDDEGPRGVYFEPVENPEAILGELLSLYRLGQRAPLPFFPRSARLYHQTLPKGVEAALGKARIEFEQPYRRRAERKDAYIDRLFGGRDPIDPAFRLFEDARVEIPSFDELARRIFDPMLERRRDVE